MTSQRVLPGLVAVFLLIAGCSDSSSRDAESDRRDPDQGGLTDDHSSVPAEPPDLCQAAGDRFPIFEPVPDNVESLDYQFVEDRVTVRVGLVGGEPSLTSRDRWTSIVVAEGPLSGPGTPTTVKTSSHDHDGVFFEKENVGVDGDKNHTSLSTYWTQDDLSLSAVSLDVPQSEVDELLQAMTVVDSSAFSAFQTAEDLDTVLCN